MVNSSKGSVKGVYLRNGNGFNYTGRRGWIQDLDAMPFPDFRKVDTTKYNVFPKRRRPISSIMSSRGCPFGCIFCSHSMGRKWRPRTAENVVAEIEWQVNTIGVKEICVFDDNFSLDRDRAVRICDLLIEKRIPVKLQFTNGLRADCLDPVLLAKLKRAGTWMIGLAPETGNREVMLKIKKGFDHARVNLIRRECRKAGIKTFGFFMIGFPFETRREIEETIRYAQELDCEIVEFNKVIPHVKTELFDMIVQSGSLMQDPTSTTTSYHEGAISTHRVGDLEPEEVKRLIRQAYRSYYLRPRKMLDLLLTFSPADLGVLTFYALRTRNI